MSAHTRVRCPCGRPDCIATEPHAWHPPRIGTNEFRVEVTEFCCTRCGHSVSICPAVPLDQLERLFGLACLGDTCTSYDLARDVDIFFEPMAEAGLIGRRDA